MSPHPVAATDNLAANFSRELADFIIYIIDVAGGDKIPRKGGPGITQADLLVINKTDLAAAVGADLRVMERDSLRMREGGPFVFAQVGGWLAGWWSVGRLVDRSVGRSVKKKGVRIEKSGPKSGKMMLLWRQLGKKVGKN